MLLFKYVGFFHLESGKKYKIYIQDNIIESVFKHYDTYMMTAYFTTITVKCASCTIYALDSQKENIQHAMELRALSMLFKRIDENFMNFGWI
jgi:hypothetical protein